MRNPCNKWIHARKQRDGLYESMLTHATIPATFDEVNKYFGEPVKLHPYSGTDTRIDWPCTWIAMASDGPAGFTSGPCAVVDPVEEKMP